MEAIFFHRDDTIVYCDNLTVSKLLESERMARPSKLLRWRNTIRQYNIILRHIVSERNSIADFLSRYKNPLTTAVQVDIPSNDKEGLEYLDNPKAKQIGTKDLKPLSEKEIENLYKLPKAYKNAFVTHAQLRQRIQQSTRNSLPKL